MIIAGQINRVIRLRPHQEEVLKTHQDNSYTSQGERLFDTKLQHFVFTSRRTDSHSFSVKYHIFKPDHQFPIPIGHFTTLRPSFWILGCFSFYIILLFSHQYLISAHAVLHHQTYSFATLKEILLLSKDCGKFN